MIYSLSENIYVVTTHSCDSLLELSLFDILGGFMEGGEVLAKTACSCFKISSLAP